MKCALKANWNSWDHKDTDRSALEATVPGRIADQKPAMWGSFICPCNLPCCCRVFLLIGKFSFWGLEPIGIKHSFKLDRNLCSTFLKPGDVLIVWIALSQNGNMDLSPGFSLSGNSWVESSRVLLNVGLQAAPRLLFLLWALANYCNVGMF